MQEGKVVIWGGFTNSEKRKEMKSKGENDRYTQLNAEFQRIARRDKAAFFNEWCKEIEANRRGNTRDLFKKIGNIKEAFHPKMDTIKDKNCRYIVDTKEIKKRWKEDMEELYKKILMNWITTMVWLVTQSQTFWSVKSSEP